MRQRFHDFRHSRPFWAGLFTILAGLEIMALPLSPLADLVLLGVAGISGALIGIVLVVLGLFAWFSPPNRTLSGVLTLVFSLAAFVVSNLGGLIVGMVLGVVGGALMLAWTPQGHRPWWSRRRDGGGPPDGAGPGAAALVLLVLLPLGLAGHPAPGSTPRAAIGATGPAGQVAPLVPGAHRPAVAARGARPALVAVSGPLGRDAVARPLRELGPPGAEREDPDPPMPRPAPPVLPADSPLLMPLLGGGDPAPVPDADTGSNPLAALLPLRLPVLPVLPRVLAPIMRAPAAPTVAPSGPIVVSGLIGELLIRTLTVTNFQYQGTITYPTANGGSQRVLHIVVDTTDIDDLRITIPGTRFSTRVTQRPGSPHAATTRLVLDCTRLRVTVAGVLTIEFTLRFPPPPLIVIPFLRVTDVQIDYARLATPNLSIPGLRARSQGPSFARVGYTGPPGAPTPAQAVALTQLASLLRMPTLLAPYGVGAAQARRAVHPSPGDPTTAPRPGANPLGPGEGSATDDPPGLSGASADPLLGLLGVQDPARGPSGSSR